MSGRILGLDVGDKRIGIALSDIGQVIASPHSVYTRVGYTPDVRHICALCKEHQVQLVVCGLPRNMDGSIGFQAQKVQGFAEQLVNAGLEVHFQDERLSTVSAHDALMQGGMRREERKTTVDKVAAAVILQQYLDTTKFSISEDKTMADDIKNNLPEEDEMESSIIELTDEDGVTSQFEYLTTIDHESELYVVLMLIQEDADEEDGEVLILKIEKDEESGEDVYVSIDDDDISQAVFEKFVAMMDEAEEE